MEKSNTTKRKNILRILSFFLFLTFMSGFVSFQVHAEDSFGISGTFSSYHYKVVPGESVESPDVYVMFFNNYDKEITVEYYTSGPEGVEFLFDDVPVDIPAGETIKVPINLSVSEEVVPGTYTIGVAAQVVPDKDNGIVITGSTQLNAKLTILGDAGSFIIRTVDYQEEQFKATIRLFRIDEDGTYPVATSDTGILEDRVVPGDYSAIAYYKDAEIGKREFSIKSGDDLELIIKVKTVFIPVFLAGPQFEESGDVIRNAQLVYTIENVFRPVTNAKLLLSVWRNNNLLETTELLAYPSLLLGQTEGRYSYIPSRGWSNGEYEFQLQILDEQEEVLAISETREILVDQYPFNWIPVLIGTIGFLLLAVIGALFKNALLQMDIVKWFILLFASKKYVAYNERLDIKYKTIQEAIDEAKAYDRITVYKGIHKEMLTINKAMHLVGPASSSLKSKAQIKTPESLDGYAMITILNTHVTIENLVFIGKKDQSCAIRIQSNNVEIKECQFQGFINPLIIRSPLDNQALQKVTITNCKLSYSDHAAILIDEASVLISNNKFEDVYYAISINNVRSNVVVEKNKITYQEDDFLIYGRTTVEGVELIENEISQSKEIRKGDKR